MRQVMRIIDIETFSAEAQAYSYVRCILQNSYSLGLLMGSYSIMNEAKISVKRTWQTSKRIGEEREKRGGLGRDERFSPLPFPRPFFL